MEMDVRENHSSNEKLDNLHSIKYMILPSGYLL